MRAAAAAAVVLLFQAHEQAMLADASSLIMLADASTSSHAFPQDHEDYEQPRHCEAFDISKVVSATFIEGCVGLHAILSY